MVRSGCAARPLWMRRLRARAISSSPAQRWHCRWRPATGGRDGRRRRSRARGSRPGMIASRDQIGAWALSGIDLRAQMDGLASPQPFLPATGVRRRDHEGEGGDGRRTCRDGPSGSGSDPRPPAGVRWFCAQEMMPAAPKRPTASSWTSPGCDEVRTSRPAHVLALIVALGRAGADIDQVRVGAAGDAVLGEADWLVGPRRDPFVPLPQFGEAGIPAGSRALGAVEDAAVGGQRNDLHAVQTGLAQPVADRLGGRRESRPSRASGDIARACARCAAPPIRKARRRSPRPARAAAAASGWAEPALPASISSSTAPLTPAPRAGAAASDRIRCNRPGRRPPQGPPRPRRAGRRSSAKAKVKKRISTGCICIAARRGSWARPRSQNLVRDEIIKRHPDRCHRPDGEREQDRRRRHHIAADPGNEIGEEVERRPDQSRRHVHVGEEGEHRGPTGSRPITRLALVQPITEWAATAIGAHPGRKRVARQAAEIGVSSGLGSRTI